MEDRTNGWFEMKALVMDKLDTVAATVEKFDAENAQAHRQIIEEMNTRFHVAPCKEISKVKEDSGQLKLRVDNIDERTKETRRTFRAIISIGLTLVGLLSGILWNLAHQGG